ncbi:MAG: competence/damage-inducible protein A, partial [Planctomycetota bacterium]
MSERVAAILTIGDELLEGRTVDTNAAFLAAALSDLGWRVAAKRTVGDDDVEIAESVTALARDADALLVTGGLGPTPDDLTREALARAAGVALVVDAEAAAEIERRAQGRAKTANARQARVPEGARVLPNPIGTAPGFAVRVSDCDVYVLPGVPVELRRMFEDHVAPLLRDGATVAPTHFVKV